ncbi:MAG: dihydrolipoyl dehydrogenase [Calditrichaeota bacterium]|nr:dihydrolipoyl dehydrogenase [Calditrichota bacterium]
MQADLAVVGGGPGGYVAAIRASQLGLKTVVIEKADLGGICLNWGCIPAKTLLRSAEVYNLMKKAGTFGLSAENLSFDFPKIIQRSRKAAEKLSRGVGFLFKKNHIETVSGAGVLADDQSIQVLDASGKELARVKSKYVLLATGAHPNQLPFAPFDGVRILSSTDALTLDKPPKSLLIVGAGAIGIEFADFYQTFGTQITLVELLPHVLPMEDEEIATVLHRSFLKRKIKIFTRSKITGVEMGADSITAQIETPKGPQEIVAEKMLVSVGVSPNSANLGLEKAGIQTEKGFIRTNEMYQTSVPSVYAVGDLIGPPYLAHVASAEGMIAVEHMAGRDVKPLDYHSIPGAVYAHPQVARVGLTEAEAREQGFDVKVGKFPFTANGKAVASGETTGLVKLVFDAKYGELLGGHIVGENASELLGEMTLAKSHEATHLSILKTVHSHPTLSEAIMEAAGDALGEAIHI